jgi:hypothetical protein
LPRNKHRTPATSNIHQTLLASVSRGSHDRRVKGGYSGPERRSGKDRRIGGERRRKRGEKDDRDRRSGKDRRSGEERREKGD